jgi:YceI-like domain
MTYRSAGIRRDGYHFVIDGELTVREVTRPVSLRLEVNGFTTDPDSGTRAGFSMSREISRLDFGVCTNPPVVGLASAKVQYLEKASFHSRRARAGTVARLAAWNKRQVPFLERQAERQGKRIGRKAKSPLALSR